MSRYDIEITESAESDLYEIGRYIARELLEPDIAKKVVSKIGNTILELEEMPLRNGLVMDERLSQMGIRKKLIDNYVVFYIVSEENKKVTIIRILYSRRNWVTLI